MKTVVISFFSDLKGSTYYSDCARALVQNCDRFGIPHDIRELPSENDYRLNCLKKPQFILDVLKERQGPVLWLDCDSSIITPLDRVDELLAGVDVAFSVTYVVKFPPGFKEWISERLLTDLMTKPDSVTAQIVNDLPVYFMGPMASPILLNYTPEAIKFIELWAKKSAAKDVTTADHDVLAYQVFPFLRSMLPSLRLGVLPAGFSHPDHMDIVYRVSPIGQIHESGKVPIGQVHAIGEPRLVPGISEQK